MRFRFQKFSLEDLEKAIPAILKSRKDNIGNYRNEHYLYWIRPNTDYFVNVALNDNEAEEGNLFKKDDLKEWDIFFLEILGEKWDKNIYYVGFCDNIRRKKLENGKTIEFIKREYFITDEDINNLQNYSLV